LNKGFIIGGVLEFENLDVEKRIHRLKAGEITLEDTSTGWAIFSVEKVDLDWRRLLGASLDRKRRENDKKESNGELFHKVTFQPNCSPRALGSNFHSSTLRRDDLRKY
jgi:hypothetical protein